MIFHQEPSPEDYYHAMQETPEDEVYTKVKEQLASLSMYGKEGQFRQLDNRQATRCHTLFYLYKNQKNDDVWVAAQLSLGGGNHFLRTHFLRLIVRLNHNE